MPSYLRSRTRKDGSKTWLVVFPTTRATNGRQPTYVSQTFEKKGDAQDYLAELRRRRKKGQVIEPSKLSLSKYLEDHYLRTLEIRENTRNSYEEVIRLYLEPALGELRLCDLEPLTIQDLYGDLTGRGLSSRTVRYAHSILHGALAAAVGWNMLDSNPSDRVTLPKPSKGEIKYLSGDEIAAFRGAAWFDRHEVYFEVAMATGCRPSELMALQWSAVDLGSGVIRIEQSLVRTKGEWFFRPPKTRKSRRSITIPTSTVEALRALKVEQAEDRLKAGPSWHDHQLVFCNAVGLPLDRTNLVPRYFKPTLKRAAEALYPAERVKNDPELQEKRDNMLGVTLYGLRHSNATALLERGVSPKTVSTRLGHKSVAFTLDVYGFTTDRMQQEAADHLEEALYG